MWNLPAHVEICEVGLRDGLQNENTLLDTQQKIQLLRGLVAAGFRVIEAGSFMNPKLVPQMADSDEVFRALGDLPGVELRALVPNLRGVLRAADCGCKKVKLNVSASRKHNLENFNMTPEQSVSEFSASVQAGRERGVDASGAISMAFASPWEGRTAQETVDSIIETYLAVGITELSLSDTSGMAVPGQVYAMSRHVREKYPQASWWLHFHNTRGLAMANILAAMQAGMTRFDTSLCGLGGCPFVPGAAGNISTEDVVHLCQESDIETGVDLEKTLELSRQLQSLLGHPTDSYVMRAGPSWQLLEMSGQ